MPGILSDPDTNGSIVPLESTTYPIRIPGLTSPFFRIRVNWARGNLLHVAFLGPSNNIGGKVVQVKLGTEEECDGEISEAERRRIAYGSVPAFTLLQSKRNSLLAMERMSSSAFRSEWWQHVLEYSNQISNLLGDLKRPSNTVIEDPLMGFQPIAKPTNLKAAWQLLEIFYVDKISLPWLPERLVEWLTDYDCLLSKTEETIHSRLVEFQAKLVNLQVVEDDSEYWEALSLALAVGWVDVVTKLLRLHGSYRPDQIGIRETENGLVEAVAHLISIMPRMRPDLPAGCIGECYKNKSDFIKDWEKWHGHISKLDCSAFWVQCSHQQTREGLRNLLQIMLGNLKNITAATCHWMELYISQLLYMRPFTVSLERLHNLAQKCMQLKPNTSSNGLMEIFLAILGENTEVVLAECSKTFGPWMLTHATDLLTVENDQAEVLLYEERDNLGGINIDEMHRLVYAQVLSSHPLTWQIAPTYLASCVKQGIGLLEKLLYRQPVQNYKMILKILEICRMYELENTSSTIMKIAGMYHWKHGMKGSGVYWFQQAQDEVRLNKIAQQLFESIGKSVSDEHFRQWEGLIELLGSRVGSARGIEFLHKYRDFKKSLQQIQNEKATDAARRAVESLIQLMKSPSTPQRFWLPLLHVSVKLLNWRDSPLLNVSETNMLLNKLQELSMAKLRPDFCDTDLPPQAVSSVRLALATNLARAILEES